MSLDETGQQVWNTRETPLSTFAASRLTQMAAAQLPQEIQDTFGALSAVVEAWWPRRDWPGKEIYEKEFAACLETYNQNGAPAKMELAMSGACFQMAGLSQHVPIQLLPPDRIAQMREPDFLLWLRAVAKAGRLPLAQLDARLKALLERRKSWADLKACADRMNWGRSGKWNKLPKRARPLAALADLGATRTWITMGDQKLLQFELDGIKRISALTGDELAALNILFPETDSKAKK